MRNLKSAGVFALMMAFGSSPASAVPITVDEILYASGTNPGSLSGTVNMTLVGNLLQITLTNTSADAAGSGAGILLTGIGFQLPAGISISSGSGAAPSGGSLSGGASADVANSLNALRSGAAPSAVAVTNSEDTAEGEDPMNFPPDAQDDEYSRLHDETMNIAAPGVLFNDSDLEMSPLTAEVVDGPTGDYVNFQFNNSTGAFIYEPEPGWAGIRRHSLLRVPGR